MAATARQRRQQRGRGHQQQQHANNIDVTAARNFGRQQRMPCIGQHPVHSLPGAAQDIEQNENNGPIANHKCDFQRKDRLMNRGYGTEKKLGACRIRAGYIRMVQRARLGCVQCRAQDRWERQDRGYSRAAARGHPTNIDEYHRRNPTASAGIQPATEQPAPAPRR